MFFADKLTLDKPRRSNDGYMAIHAKAARSGIYQYLGREVDREGKHFAADQVVNVYRPADEVFDKASLGSFVGKPITDDHPSEAVTSENWRDHARGTVMGAAKDGEFVGFDLAFMDAAVIAAIDAGKSELSNGYDCRLDIEDGTAPDGTEYQAVQRAIRGNHVAVVDAGRAGSSCRIGDAAQCAVIASDAVRNFLIDQRTYEAARDDGINGATDTGNGVRKVATKTILVDGLQVEVTDAAEAAINKLQGALKDAADAKAKADTEIADRDAKLAAKDAELAKLKDELEQAKVTPQMLRDAAKAYANVCDKAKALGVEFAEDADAAAIKKAVVDAKLADAAKDYTEAQIDAAFAVLAKDAKVEDKNKSSDPLTDGIRQGFKPIADAATAMSTARRGALARKESAYLAAAE